MFENPFLVFIVVVIVGMSLIGKYNDFCSMGDWFNGRAFSWKHEAEHIDREFRGFFYVLAIAVFAGFIALIGSCLFSNDYEPKKVFIKDLVGPQTPASGAANHKLHAQANSAKAHTPGHEIKAHKASTSHTTKTHAQNHVASSKVQSNTVNTTKQSHAASAKVASH
ncbi:MAG: hypothetical protein IPL73_11000 [Candidatus Obscuribacter sp.]|nr:hypothetical protein [Candidatus Obscuribacter sp.]MBK9620963.1 hypothetical protein [Candidatus Obscuribacter sp.]